jgi:tRNA G18 (ribose-2'-O)-methylase SpoU
MKGFFAIGVYHPKNELNIGTLWRTAHVFGAAFIYTIGARYRKQSSDTMKTPNALPLFHFVDIADLREHLPSACPLVGLELTDAATPAHRHWHLERSCYLLGAEDHGLPPSILAQCHAVLKLPGSRSLNVSVAGSLVVYDRWLQAQPERIEESMELLEHA